jgi:hypothetical protein
MHHIRHHFGEETEESFGLSMEEGEKNTTTMVTLNVQILESYY